MQQEQSKYDEKKFQSTTTKNQDVTDFLQRFGQALTAGNLKAIAACWSMPSFFVDDKKNIAISSSYEIENFFSGVKEQYNSKGISEAKPVIQKIEWATDHLANVEVRWPYINQYGQQIGAETSVYTVKRDDTGDVKIVVVMMKGVEGKH